jgi:hypothetical protein
MGAIDCLEAAVEAGKLTEGHVKFIDDISFSLETLLT